MTGPIRESFDRPIFIVSTPRSGSTLLFETLAQAPNLFSVGGESHALIEGIPELTPAAHGWHSNILAREDAPTAVAEQLARNFYRNLRDRDGKAPTARVRMLEKTPKNALRVEFFDAIWPDAHFVYLYRDPRPALSSMIEAWMSGRFRTYPRLPAWPGPPWSLLLVPGWPELSGMPLPMIVAHQWAITTDVLVGNLERLAAGRVMAIDYADLIARPQLALETLARSLDLVWDRELNGELPLSRYTVSRPSAEKWRAIQNQIEPVLPIVAEADRRAREFLNSRKVAIEGEFASSQVTK